MSCMQYSCSIPPDFFLVAGELKSEGAALASEGSAAGSAGVLSACGSKGRFRADVLEGPAQSECQQNALALYLDFLCLAVLIPPMLA